VPGVSLDSTNRAGAVPKVVKLGKEASDFLALESAVTPGGDAVCLYSSIVTPPPQGVRMDMEELGDLPHRHHVVHMFIICHIFSHLLFN
jgi:hypothetical protein